MRSMTSEELRALKPNDTVYIRGTVTVTKVGRKYIHLSNNEKIDIERGRTSHPNYTQWEREVFKDKDTYTAYSDYCTMIDNANKVIRDFLRGRNTNGDIIAVADFIKQLKEKGANAPHSLEPSEYD